MPTTPTTPTVRDLTLAMESLAPTRLAADWDNVGLLVGDPARPLTRALLCVDLTRAVWEEAVQAGADAIVAYHPPLFRAQKRFVAGDLAYEAAARGVALYSPHTALDAAAGGTNDLLAEALGLLDPRPLGAAIAKDHEHKLVTFVPEEALERVAAALAFEGAGVIGEYTSCSFRSPGTGTFRGSASANPVVGQREKLEHAPEVRLEVVVPIAKTAAVVRALRAAHPYETPAFDLVRLAPAPDGPGYGRVGRVAEQPAHALVARAKAALGLERLLVAGDLSQVVRCAAVGAGASGELLPQVIAEGATFFLLGELRHHDALAANKAGVAIACTLHSNSERAALGRLAERLAARVPGVVFTCSAADRDPFDYA